MSRKLNCVICFNLLVVSIFKNVNLGLLLEYFTLKVMIELLNNYISESFMRLDNR